MSLRLKLTAELTANDSFLFYICWVCVSGSEVSSRSSAASIIPIGSNHELLLISSARIWYGLVVSTSGVCLYFRIFWAQRQTVRLSGLTGSCWNLLMQLMCCWKKLSLTIKSVGSWSAVNESMKPNDDAWKQWFRTCLNIKKHPWSHLS